MLLRSCFSLTLDIVWVLEVEVFATLSVIPSSAVSPGKLSAANTCSCWTPLPCFRSVFGTLAWIWQKWMQLPWSHVLLHFVLPKEKWINKNRNMKKMHYVQSKLLVKCICIYQSMTITRVWKATRSLLYYEYCLYYYNETATVQFITVEIQPNYKKVATLCDKLLSTH